MATFQSHSSTEGSDNAATLLPAVELISTTQLQLSTANALSQDRVTAILRADLEMKLMRSIKAIILSRDTREAPWYGPWAIALDLLFMDLTLPSNAMWVTTPQLPVVRGYDPAVTDDLVKQAIATEDSALVDSEDAQDDGGPLADAQDEDEDADMEPAEDLRLPANPLKERLANLGNITPFSWPAQDAYQAEGSSFLTDTQPSTPIRPMFIPSQPPNSARTLSFSSDTDFTTSHKRSPTRSTRVPDFSTLIHLFDEIFKALISTYLILIVEIKPPKKNGHQQVISATLSQVLEQAKHAFAADKSLKVLGCMICAGDAWTYFDIKREHIPPSPTQPTGRTRSATARAPPQLPPASSRETPDMPAPFLQPLFDDAVFLRLSKDWDRSKLAFDSVLKKLKARITT